MSHTSGLPCQHVTDLLAQCKGFSGERSRLADYIPFINDMLQSLFPEAEICSLCEMLASLDEAVQKQYDKFNQSKPFWICPSQMYAVRRLRRYWINWKFHSQQGIKVSSHSRWTELTLTATRKMATRRWIPKGWRCHVKSPLFPTFFRAIERRKPPCRPAGIKGCPPHVRQRYAALKFIYPPSGFWHMHFSRPVFHRNFDNR